MGFVPIRTSTLRGDQKISFDVFVQINSRNVLYLRKGDSFEGVRLERLKKKKLKKMFISAESEEDYRSYLSSNLEMAYDSKSGKSLGSRAEIIHGAQQNNAEAVMEEPGSQFAYTNAKEGAARYVEFLMKEQSAASQMLNIENQEQDLGRHAVAVSTLAIALAHKLSLKNQTQLQLLGLGALLHDFGHAQSHGDLFLPLAELSKERMLEYMKHPLAGADSVRDKRHFDPAVIAIIAQHEELVNGTGYPNKLIEKQTDPLAVLVSTANDFDRLVASRNLSHKDTLKDFMVSRVGLHPLEHIQALKSIV